MITIFDSESNGFYGIADKVWCIVTLGYDDESPKKFGPKKLYNALQVLADSKVIVGHNIIEHDLPLFKDLLHWSPTSDQIIIDTLVYSRMLYPKRPLPARMLGSKSGPHSIEAWGCRLGLYKPEHEEWDKYSPEMLQRCSVDTLINRMVLKELERESEQEMFYHKA